MRFRTFLRSIWLVLVAVVGSRTAPAQCGAWQTGFGSPGPDGPFLDFVTFDDGTGPALYACGNFRSIGGDRVQGVVRWNGARWEQVGTGLFDVAALAVIGNGLGALLVAGGKFTEAAGAVADVVAVWSGSVWRPLTGLQPYSSLTPVEDMVAFDDGTGPALYLTGSVLVMSSGGKASVARWRNGTWSDASAGIATTADPAPLAVFDAGTGPQLYLGASGPLPLARWSGAGWTNAAPTLTQFRVNALAVSTVGGSPALYVGGEEWSGFPSPFNGIARFDGTSLSALGSGLHSTLGISAGSALREHDFGAGPRLVVGGRFDRAGEFRCRGLAAWNGSAWEGLASDFDRGGWPRALASFDDGSGLALFVGGHFTQVGGVVSPYAARLQYGVWSRFAREKGVTGSVTFLGTAVVNGERNLLAAGPMSAAGTSAVTRVARYDGSRWHAIGSLDLWYDVRTLAEADLGSGPQLYAGGGSESHFFDRCVAIWNGTSWSPVGQLYGAVHALLAFDDGSGMALYAAGNMQGGDVQRWNGTDWQILGAFPGTGYGYEVTSLCIHDDGSGPELYGSGQFPGGRGVARWTGSTWVFVSSGLFLGNAPSRLVSFDDGTGPELWLAGPVTGNGLSSWLARRSGSSWTVIFTNGMVRALTVLHDGVAPRLCVTRTVFGQHGPETRVSKRVGDGWVDIGFTAGAPSALASFDTDRDGVPELFLGGDFRSIEDIPSLNVARYAGCPTAGTIVCAGDGSGSTCPCGNSGSTGHGCANSVHASGARLANGGLASITTDTFRLDASALTGTIATFAQGSSVPGGTGIPFHDGLVCTTGLAEPLGFAAISDGVSFFPPAGGPRISQLGLVMLPGQTRVYQAIYRNAASFCTSGTSNGTNGLQVTWSL